MLRSSFAKSECQKVNTALQPPDHIQLNEFPILGCALL
jgi:hypothetical protein